MGTTSQHKIITSDKKWLIRSSLKILGPFTVQEVTQLIAARQIAIIDEVKQPNERWTYIRENPIFVELVKALRNEQETSVEHTMATSTTTNQTQRLGMTRTDVVFTDDMTPPPASAKETQFKDITEVKERKIDGNVNPLSQSGKSYGSATDPRIFEKRKNFEKNLKLSLVILIISLVGALYLRHFIREKDKSESLTKIEKIAHLQFTQGLGKSSLSGFRKVLQLRSISEEFQYDYAVLLVHTGEYIEGRRKLEAILAQPSISRDRKVDLLNVLGSSYLEEGNLKLAADSFRKAQAFDSSNLTSQLNYLQLKLAQKQFVEAFRMGNQILARYPQEVELKVLLNLAAVQALSAGFIIPELDNYLSEQRKFLGKRNFLAQEFALTYLHILVLKNKGWDKSFEQLLWQVFNANLFQRSLFSENFYLSRSFFLWKHYQSSCQSLAQETQNAYSEILLAYCYLEGDALQDAQALIEKILTSSPRNTLAIILQGAFLMKTGKVTEAIAAFNSVASSQYPLGNYLKMQACYNDSSVSCAADSASRILKLKPSDSIASYYEAESLIASEQKRQAWDAISRGLSMDANYTPLIELRSQLEGSF